MNQLTLLRLSSEDDSTIGALYDNDERLLCFTLEDEYREKKVKGETRIPGGLYHLKLRTHGGFHSRYSDLFPDIHEGMIEICDVPGFTDILMHIGNHDDNTAGCILVGVSAMENRFRNGWISNSTEAYKRVYPVIRDMIKNSDTYIKIKDIWQPGRKYSP